MPTTLWEFRAKDNLSSVLDKVNAKLDTLQMEAGQTESAFKKSLGGIGAKFSQFHRQNIDKMDDLIQQFPVLGKAMDILKNPVTGIIAGTAAIGTGLFKAGQSAAEFEKNMAKVNVTAQLNKKQLSDLSGQLQQTALNLGGAAPLQDVPQAFNKIISAGLDVNQSLQALEPTLKAAKAGFTDIETVAGAGVSVLNSTGIKDATKVYDVLFATLNKGNVEFRDIAQYLPKIIPSARTLGIEFEEVAGAFAFMTAQGQTAEGSTTGLINLVKAFGSKERISAFKQIGIDIFDSQGKMRGIFPIVEDLGKKLNTLKSDQDRNKLFASLGLDLEATQAISVLTQDTEKLSSILRFTAESSGQLEQAFANSANTTDKWQATLNKVAFIGVKIGAAILPIVGKGLDMVNSGLDLAIRVGQGFGNVAGWLNGHLTTITDTLKVGVAAWAGYRIGVMLTTSQGLIPYVIQAGRAVIATASLGIQAALTAGKISIVTAAQTAWNFAVSANPIGVLVGALALLGTGLYIAYQRSERFRAGIAGIVAVAKATLPVFEGLGTAIAGVFSFNPAKIGEGIAKAVSSVKDITKKGIGNIFNEGYNASIEAEPKQVKDIGANIPTAANTTFNAAPNATPPSSIPNNTPTPAPASSPVSNSIAAVTGGSGGQTKNVNVRIDKLVENITIQSTSTTDVSQIRQIIERELVRAVSDSENIM